MLRHLLAVLVVAALVAGCDDGTSPRDVTAPAAPRGLFSTTGDGTVKLKWLGNTERDLAGYRVYIASSGAPGAKYSPVAATTSTQMDITGLSNGVTRYFAVAAYDHAGNESDLSYDDIFDTPRPAGYGEVLANASTTPGLAGYDFSAYSVRAADDDATDMYFTNSGGVASMVCPFVDTDIQDAGYATSLDAVDFAPAAGWSPSGAVELIAGHCYVVWTYDNHYAKFRVTGLTSGQLTFDWAYQTATGNPELLRAQPDGDAPRQRRAGFSAHSASAMRKE